MSHVDSYHRDNSRISLIKERGGLRIPEATKDAQLAKVLSIDIPEEGEVTVLRPKLKRERRYTIGGGRLPNLVSELGYDPVDESLNFYLQSARFLYGVLGSCVTSGTSYSPAKTDVILSGAGSAVLTLTTGGLTINAHVGDMLKLTSGVYSGTRLLILSNTANTITVPITTPAAPAGINGASVEIFKGPWLHTMAVGSDLPSFASHIYIPNTVSAETICVDLLGMVIKTWECTIEKAADAVQSVGFLVAKAIDGNSALSIPADPGNELMMKWCEIDTLTVTYNSKSPITKDICDSIKINIENGAEIKHVVGDCYGSFKNVGTAELTVTMHYFPNSRTFYDLINTPIASYVTTLPFLVKITRDVNHYIQLSIDKMYLSDHPELIPNKDDSIMGIDAEFKPMPNAVVSAIAKDDFNIDYYERSTIVYTAP